MLHTAGTLPASPRPSSLPSTPTNMFSNCSLKTVVCNDGIPAGTTYFDSLQQTSSFTVTTNDPAGFTIVDVLGWGALGHALGFALLACGSNGARHCKPTDAMYTPVLLVCCRQQPACCSAAFARWESAVTIIRLPATARQPANACSLCRCI